MRLLAVGTSVRHVAQSASRFADVVAIDEFGDLDTRRYAEETIVVDEVSEESVAEAARDLEFDYVLTTSPNVPKSLPLLGNSVEVMRRAGDKWLFARYCEENEVPHPETRLEPSPVTPLAKPRLAGGGVNNELTDEPRKRHVYQELVEGTPLSASVVSDGEEARTVAVNETLSGVETCWPPNRFAYCGNVTPASHPFAEEAGGTAEEVVEDLGLKGSVGVDFIAAEERLVVLEVNPRIQASLDTVEASTGLNVVKKHLEAVRGEPDWSRGFGEPPSGAACRLVLYAPRDTVTSELSLEGLRDVPPPGRGVDKGEPLVSVFRKAGTPAEALREAEAAAERVYEEIR